MRFRTTICVDIFVDNIEEAEKKVEDIVLGIPNSFQIALSKMPHGSKISFEQEGHDQQV